MEDLICLLVTVRTLKSIAHFLNKTITNKTSDFVYVQ